MKTINNLEKFNEEFKRWRAHFYESTDEAAAKMQSNLASLFDELIENEDFLRECRKFNDWREDFISSDREAAAYVMALWLA